MRSIVATLAALLVLALAAGCGRTPVVEDPPEPVPENCDISCRTPCSTDAIRYRPDPDTDRALDELVDQVVVPLRVSLDVCDLHRQACVQCLDRLKRAGVTR